MAKDFIIEAQVEIPEGGAEGMIVTEGGRFGGYGLFLSKGIDGHSVGATWCSCTTCSISSARCGKGRNSSRANTPSGSTSSTTAPVSAKVARVSCSWTTSPWPRRRWNTRRRSMFPEDEDFDVGQDTRTGVAMIEYRYDCPFKFTGKIDKLRFDLGPAQYTAQDRKQLPAIAERVARAKD